MWYTFYDEVPKSWALLTSNQFPTFTLANKLSRILTFSAPADRQLLLVTHYLNSIEDILAFGGETYSLLGMSMRHFLKAFGASRLYFLSQNIFEATCWALTTTSDSHAPSSLALLGWLVIFYPIWAYSACFTQAAQLGIHFFLPQHTVRGAPPWGTWLGTLHW